LTLECGLLGMPFVLSNCVYGKIALGELSNRASAFCAASSGGRPD
jgi:hypothetical protein